MSTARRSQASFCFVAGHERYSPKISVPGIRFKKTI
jgi:hypothetical protein